MRRRHVCPTSGLQLGMTIVLLVTPLLCPASSSGQTFTVDFSTTLGAPTYRATGFIYGLSEDTTNPPRHFVSDIKTQFFRVGGAQLGCPNGGWVNSTSNYTRRWNTVKAYYNVAKTIGARLIILVHDLWGADLVCTVNEFPGDGGNWTRFDTFINQVLSDAKAAGMTGQDVIWDLWNEPDCCGFWGDRSEDQYLQMWQRSYKAVRAALPTAVISGPSANSQPTNGNGWFTAFLDSIKANSVVPDYLSWHQLPGPDPNISKSTADSWLSSRGLKVLGYQINEYGSPGGQQGAAGSGWYIGRLDRLGIDGARANWGMYGGLWDTMGDLVVSSSGTYGALAAWWMYKRYADSTGQRITLSADNADWDGTAATDSAKGNAIIVLGNNLGDNGGSHTVKVNLTHLDKTPYLVANNQIHVVVERMPETRVAIAAPTTVSSQDYPVTNNQVSLSINWTTANDGYALTVTGTPSTGGTGGTGAGGAIGSGGNRDAGAGGATSTGGSNIGGAISGGVTGAGGKISSGGSSGAGGAVATGGTSSATGGAGGVASTGGTVASGGGSPAGGAIASGGALASGGAISAGGISGASGGNASGQGGVSQAAGGAGGSTRSSGTPNSGCSCALGSRHNPTGAVALFVVAAVFVRRRLRC